MILIDITRFRQIPTFGRTGTIRKFSSNASEMKKLAGRDFEDLLQCAIPAFEGLLQEPHNTRLLRLLFRTAEWHAFAKLRLQTDSTLARLEQLTTEFGRLMREFRDYSCSEFHTVKLPREREKRQRNNKKGSQTGSSTRDSASSSTQTARKLNLDTYKFHALGDYFQTIKLFGPVDSYSTQIVSCLGYSILCINIVTTFIGRTCAPNC